MKSKSGIIVILILGIFLQFALPSVFSQNPDEAATQKPITNSGSSKKIRYVSFSVQVKAEGSPAISYSAIATTNKADGSTSTETVEAEATSENQPNEEAKEEFVQQIVTLVNEEANEVKADPNGNGDYHPGEVFPEGPFTIIFTPDYTGLPPKSLQSKTFKYRNIKDFNARFIPECKSYLDKVF